MSFCDPSFDLMFSTDFERQRQAARDWARLMATCVPAHSAEHVDPAQSEPVRPSEPVAEAPVEQDLLQKVYLNASMSPAKAAETFLRTMLSRGPVPAKVIEDGADKLNIDASTLSRKKKYIGVSAKCRATVWVWRLTRFT